MARVYLLISMLLLALFHLSLFLWGVSSRKRKFWNTCKNFFETKQNPNLCVGRIDTLGAEISHLQWGDAHWGTPRLKVPGGIRILEGWCILFLLSPAFSSPAKALPANMIWKRGNERHWPSTHSRLRTWVCTHLSEALTYLCPSCYRHLRETLEDHKSPQYVVIEKLLGISPLTAVYLITELLNRRTLPKKQLPVTQEDTFLRKAEVWLGHLTHFCR